MSTIRRALSLKREAKVHTNSLTAITDEHIIPLVQLCQRLQTNSVDGMTESDVKQILKKEGKNKINRPKRPLSTEVKDIFNGQKQFTKAEWNRIFGKHIPETAIVVRDGEEKEIAGEDIVVGDLVHLEEQDIVPADIRLKLSADVVVDNRLITGQARESRTHEVKEATRDYLISPNIVFAGTKILHGHCVGIVLKTGENTVFAALKNHARKVVLL